MGSANGARIRKTDVKSDLRRNARPRASRWMGLAGAVLMAAPAVAVAGPLDLYVERTAMAAADARCDLFDPALRAALDAGRAQSRNAALRAGATASQISQAESRAVQAGASANCAAPGVQAAADHVRQAFDGFGKVRRAVYPGMAAEWRADRSSSPDVHTWRLVQDGQMTRGRMVFGLAGRDSRPVLLTLASFADGATPYAARLVFRDETRASTPYIGAGSDLSRRLPPRGALAAVPAEARSRAGLDLRPEDMGAGWAFRFPADAAARLARLDPREAVAVEFLFSSGAPVRRAYVEVGDFAPGRAFIRLATR